MLGIFDVVSVCVDCFENLNRQKMIGVPFDIQITKIGKSNQNCLPLLPPLEPHGYSRLICEIQLTKM